MDFTHDNLWENLEQVLSKELSLADSWTQFIGLLSDLKAKNYWPALLAVDVLVEKAEIADWLNGVILISTLPPQVTALWIGIAELYDEESESELYAYYLQGSDIYDENDIEWTTDPLYEPQEKYIIPDVLNEIRAIIRDDIENYSILDWILPLAYSLFLFKDIIRVNLNKELFLKNTDKLHVSLGYDSGDFVALPAIV